ncbi:transient-receptor-potential-like protein isoform X1 [Drosophila obscura]|uniref:transient-receptor-potential-like protein isoform X1 n=1 Tax=Drosophila obscura TaxID=7282 RepID=UPI001BB1D34D|nr:transient-receptor-potential-like protein isoform X1 [Drosophila obscura]
MGKPQRPLCDRVEQLHTFLCAGMQEVSSGGATRSGSGRIRTSAPPTMVGGCCIPLGLPQPLLLEEKKFLLAVERGDMPNVRRILQKALRHHHININCMDPLGRRALTLAIDNENLEMVELLVVMGVETKDALLHAINAEFVEAVELLLEHEELIYKEGELYSWQKVDINTAMFAPDITPLMLAAHKNNFEILRILLDRGAAVPVPHDIRCGCEECIRLMAEDSLRHSLSRVNIYRALCSPSLICLTSSDPILTAFQLSWDLRNLALTEQECKAEYIELRRQCQNFAVDLLDQTRTSNELAIILNYDPQMSSYEPGDRMSLSRLVQAISYKQKKFVAHSNIQQLLSSIWYDGLPGFRRKSIVDKIMCIAQVAVLFPLYCFIYIFAPNCQTGRLMRKPFMKFLIHASSYLFFLFILILVSQRADDDFVRIFGTARMKAKLVEQELRQRGQAPSKLELVVVLYVAGFMWEEVQEIFAVGMKNYLRNMWNFIDFLRNTLYVSVMCLRAFAYIQQATEIARDSQMAYIPREKWHDFDPQLIAEGLFAAANVFSALKLVHLFSINPHLGPLQISLGRMVIDIVKFFFIYSLVLFAFACGLNQLLWYFAALEKSKCYVLPGGEADWGSHGDSCMKWRRFGNLFESSQSLFWASFGMVGLDDFELSGIKSYTRFWGLLMFGSYSVINVIVLLNLLIAMMSNSYAMIDEHSDTEWKFARTKLWMSYFEDSATLPPPFNVLPSVKWLIRLFRKSSKVIDRQRSKQKRLEQEEFNKYDNIMRSLVWRYVAAMHRKFEQNPVSEDDINEVKSEINTMRYEMLEIFENSGMDVSSANKKERQSRPRRIKVWERRLMKGFQVAPVQTSGESDACCNVNGEGDMREIKVESIPSRPAKETARERFQRVARTVLLQSSTHKWNVVLQGTLPNSQIGRCTKNERKNLQNLGKAIEEAKRLIMLNPGTSSGRESPIRIEFEDEKSSTLLQLLNQISEEISDRERLRIKSIWRPPLKSVTARAMAANHGRSHTAPELKISRKSLPAPPPAPATAPATAPTSSGISRLASNRSRELPLCPSKLVTAAPAVQKSQAPTASATSSRTPFSVERKGPGHSSDGMPAGNPNSFDIHVVDLDERSRRVGGDNCSDISSIASTSPQRPKRGN